MRTSKQKGSILIPTLFVSVIAGAFIITLTTLAISNLNYIRTSADSELAFQIAESGIEYYRWHLAHAPQDFQNGTGQPGPYTIDYKDKNGAVIGQFVLDITPPPTGSTVVTILSTGHVNTNASIVRKIKVKFAITSLAKYAVAANDTMRFGVGTEVFGPIHSNGGIHFDGLAHNIITSAVATYNDPDHSGNAEFGVHTHVDPVDPYPPAAVPVRPDVFQAGRQFPVPVVDFAGLTANLASLKATAQASNSYFGPSGGGSNGYHVVLKTNDTFDLYKVTSLVQPPNGCIQVLGEQDWGSWSVQNQTLLGSYAFPASGIIFFEDDVWVDGQIQTARLTIAAGRFPDNSSQRKSITVNNDLRYSAYDGSDSIALIAQDNINAGMVSADVLRIDAALVAQNGRVGRFYYRPPGSNQNRCAPYHIRNTITLYGLIITNQTYGFAYTDGTGYQTRNIIYDPNMLYAPPPSFPLASDSYEVISWEEVH